MNFIIYCCIFPHICILYKVIFMFYNVLWGFFVDPLSLVFNSAEQENPILCIFKFQGPYETQIDLGFFEDKYFCMKTTWST